MWLLAETPTLEYMVRDLTIGRNHEPTSFRFTPIWASEVLKAISIGSQLT